MKNISKILLSFLILALGFNASAQKRTGATLGLRAGVGYQNINGKDQTGGKLKFDMVPRFHGGLVAEIPLGGQLYVQPSLLYTTKGAESKNNFLGTTMSTEFNLAYVELPLNLLY
ncbi:MAG TPA: outer membrane beta-barrel protein, partial [Phnomibacter sp.]|nr:outer membrane beta-barrel protein [Phnomibacter sp.]